MHGRPSAAELAEAVQEFLRTELMPALEGRLQFHTRVAANVLGIIQRELQQTGAQEQHAARLSALGAGDDADLAARIRAGEFDDRLPELVTSLRQDAVARVLVANPAYLVESDRR
ncbi:MAG: hypothetical protein JWN57_250 [Frankiales bacterium]|jgi:hypothetical protein|nr:hypothetical protein [Frankiales bacterium]